MHHHRIATLFHPLQLLAHPPLAHAHLLGRLALPQHPVPGPFQPFQLVPFLVAHLDSFHPSALRLSRGTFYLAQLGTFHLAATARRRQRSGSLSFDNLYQSLPQPPFTDDETEQVSDRVYNFIWGRSASQAAAWA